MLFLRATIHNCLSKLQIVVSIFMRNFSTLRSLYFANLILKQKQHNIYIGSMRWGWAQ